MTPIVHAAGHVKINTDRMADCLRDATDILGLHVTHEGEGRIWLSANGRAAELVLVEADANAANTLGFEALSVDAVRAAEAQVEAAGCTLVSAEPSLPCFAAGVTFDTPEGLRFEIHSPARDDMYRPRHATTGVGPRRFDHMNLLTPDPQATARRLNAIGGLRMSEKMANDALTWMYGGNRQHHVAGLVKGPAAGLHHYSFEFPEFNMYCRLGDILDRHDRQIMWGPGRHRPGDNTYAYYVDSSGVIVECSGPMASVAEDAGFAPRIITNLDRPGNVRDMNVWGSPAPLEWREHFFPFMALS